MELEQKIVITCYLGNILLIYLELMVVIFHLNLTVYVPYDIDVVILITAL